MSDETQFKHNARGNMDLNKKRDELGNKYWKDNRDYHDSDGVDVHATFCAGFDAAVEILSAEIKELDRLFRLARDQRNEAEDKVKELEKALEGYYDFFAEHIHWVAPQNRQKLDDVKNLARQTLSKLRGGK